MTTYNIRIALESNIRDARLKRLLGKKYVVDVESVLFLLSDIPDAEYALIVHDRDNTCNKPHLHLVVKSNHSLMFWKVCFPIGYCEECRSYEASLLYLLHRGHADKKQYSVSDLYTNIDYYARFPFLKGVC